MPLAASARSYIQFFSDNAFDPELPDELLGTYLRIKHFDREQGCWATVEAIAAGKRSVSQTRAHIRQLERLGYVQVENRPGRQLLIRCLDPHKTVLIGKRARRGTPPVDRRTHPAGQPTDMKYLQGEVTPDNNTQPERQAAVVVPDEVVSEGTVLALELPEDLAELPRERKGLSLAALRRLVGTYAAETVRYAVRVVDHQYPGGKGLQKPFGAVLTKALAEGWTNPQLDARLEREAREAAAKEATPPPGTRYAMRKSDGKLLQVTRMSSYAVFTEGDQIQAVDWPNWVWLDQEPEKPALQAAQEAPCNHSQVLDDLAADRARVDAERLDDEARVNYVMELLNHEVPYLRARGHRLAAELGLTVTVTPDNALRDALR